MELFKYFLISLLLCGSIESFRLDCEFRSQFTGEECKVKKLKVLENDVAITEISGIHSASKTNNDVKGIYINSEVETEIVPTKVCNFFGNLERVDIYGNSIKQINREVFTNCKKVWKVIVVYTSLTTLPEDLLIDLIELRELNLYENKIVSLPADLFAKNTKLNLISARNNQLSFIDTELPQSMTSIDFRGNICVDKKFPDDITDLKLFTKEVSSNCSIKQSCLAKAIAFDKTLSEKAKEIADWKQKSETLKSENVALSSTIKQQKTELRSLKSKISSFESESLILKSKTFILESQLSNSESKKSKENSLQSSFNAIDGNFNAATNIMSKLSKALKACDPSALTAINNLGLEQEVELVYEEKNGTGVAVDFTVQFDNSKIEENSNASKLTSLTITKQQTLFLPTNFGETFSKLEELEVTYSGLFSIENTCLTGFKHLQTLILKGNKIYEIPSKAFTEVETLKTLDLSENKIEKIEVGAFNHLESLVELNLMTNFLTTVTTETFERLVKLKILNLSNNKINSIGNNFLAPLKSIEKVDFTKNACIDISFPETKKKVFVETINEKCFLSVTVEIFCNKFEFNERILVGGNDDVCNIQEITIQYPKTKISKVFFTEHKETSKISTLKIIGQSMKFIPLELSKTFPNLERIVIESSELTSLNEKDFDGLKKLKNLEITGNNLTSIAEGTFDEVTQLEVLNLSSNEIVSLPSKAFANLKYLKKLILSFNQLEKFTADLLPIKSSIEEFRISNNELEIIEARTLRRLKHAKVIDFSKNVCIDKEVNTERKEMTNVCKNHFEDLSGAIYLRCSSDN